MKITKKPGSRLHHLRITPAENGFSVEHHIVRKGVRGDSGAVSSDDYPNHQVTHVFDGLDSAVKHVKEALAEHERSEGHESEGRY
jgi:hypothetical protein